MLPVLLNEFWEIFKEKFPNSPYFIEDRYFSLNECNNDSYTEKWIFSCGNTHLESEKQNQAKKELIQGIENWISESFPETVTVTKKPHDIRYHYTICESKKPLQMWIDVTLCDSIAYVDIIYFPIEHIDVFSFNTEI